MPTIGLVGKPSSGKSTFFSAATMATVEISPRPFTTIKPNVGTGYVRVDCIDKELGVQCDPREGFCINGIRYVPVELVDVAGLIPGAHVGKGLGNQFLNDLARAEALIHIVDISGSTDEQGRFVGYGKHDPQKDVEWLEHELNMWYKSVIERNMHKMERLKRAGEEDWKLIMEMLSSFGVSRPIAEECIKLYGKVDAWGPKLDDVAKFLREKTKPSVVAANKIDLPGGAENFKKLDVKYKFPVSSESELALKRAANAGLVSYVPGSKGFEPLKELNADQKAALSKITEVLDKWGATGVQQALEETVFNMLKYIVIFPAGSKLEDSKGNILPDAFLMPSGSTVHDFAMKIHSDIANNLLYGVDVRKKLRLGKAHVLKHRDGIELVSAAKK